MSAESIHNPSPSETAERIDALQALEHTLDAPFATPTIEDLTRAQVMTAEVAPHSPEDVELIDRVAGQAKFENWQLKEEDVDAAQRILDTTSSERFADADLPGYKAFADSLPLEKRMRALAEYKNYAKGRLELNNAIEDALSEEEAKKPSATIIDFPKTTEKAAAPAKVEKTQASAKPAKQAAPKKSQGAGKAKDLEGLITNLERHYSGPAVEASKSVEIPVTDMDEPTAVAAKGAEATIITEPVREAAPAADVPTNEEVTLTKTPHEVMYKNGVKHLYRVDADGKKKHLSYGQILAEYGHAGDMQGKPSLKRLEATEADASLESRELSDEQWEQFETAIQTHDRRLLPEPVSDAEWKAMTGSTAQAGPAPAEFLARKGTPDQWENLLNDEQRARFMASLEAEAETAGDQEIEEDPELAVTEEDATQGPQSRARRIMGWASRHLTALKETVYTNGKNIDPKRAKIAGAVVGVVAVGTAVWLGHKYGGAIAQDMRDFVEGKPAPQAPQPRPPKSGMPPAASEYVTTRLHKGSSLWDIAKERLSRGGHHPTNRQITIEDHRLARLNHINIAAGQDRHMPIDEIIKLARRK